MRDWNQIVYEKEKDLIKVRRYLHQHPETSFNEEKTHQFILEHLKQLEHFEIEERVAERGIVAKISGVAPGPTIALRADFDALPIQDAKDVPYKSKVDGVMHACGHDGHTSTLLTVADILSKYQMDIKGTVVLIFQYAEELNPGGAKPMIESGCLNGVDKIYGNHYWSGHPTASIRSTSGEMMASPDFFQITVKGKGGHGAKPHTSVDSIVIISELITSIQKIVSREINPADQGVITIGKVTAGSAFNVISDKATLEGTVRTFKEEVKDLIETRLEEITKYITKANNASYDFNYRRGYPTVINHKNEYQIIKQATKELGLDYDDTEKMMVGEDFAYYLQERPGAFFLTGSGNEIKQTTAPHHHPLFDLDEDALPVATKMFIKILQLEGVLAND